MGEHRVEEGQDAAELRRSMKQVLVELETLERMLASGVIESGVHKVGAEQEVCLVDGGMRPAPINLELLGELDDPHFTTELGRFNLEFNLDPQSLDERCLDRLETQLRELLERLRRVAEGHRAHVVLCGLLPSLELSDLSLDNMTPVPRYRALNDALTRLRGGDYHFFIKGQDELSIRHDNVMLEAATTSFQFHLQVGPEEFARLYNIAQLAAAPVLAVSANSPLLFGRRLWRETRIALFQQSIDTRQDDTSLREQQPRVSFGTRWVDASVLEILHEDLTRFRLLLASQTEEDSMAEVAAGRAPLLKALRLHNGTVYRWNRPCYGISESGRPHLRIEARMLPSGPSIPDEMANAAYWLGLMRGLDLEMGDVRKRIDFGTARENFFAAARLGITCQLAWPDLSGELPSRSITELTLERLLPIAKAGLEDLGIAGDTIERHLGVLEARVRRGRTGSRWHLESLKALEGQGTSSERLAALTGAVVAQQKEGKPVAEWRLATLEDGGDWAKHYSKVEHLMSRDLFTVHEDELVDLAAAMMDWQHIRHVPVEDSEHHLVGLVTHRTLLRHLARSRPGAEAVPVKDIMQRDLVTASPEMPTLEAIARMRQHKIACLPVVQEGRLVGIVTERDFMTVARKLLERELGG